MMRSFPGVRAPNGTDDRGGGGRVGPVGRSPLPRGFVQPLRRRGRPGSPVGLTVAGQRRFPTGLRLRGACACRTI